MTLVGGRLESDRKKMRRRKHPQPYDVLKGGDTLFHGSDRSWGMEMPERVSNQPLNIMSPCQFHAPSAANFGYNHPCAGDTWTNLYNNRKGNRKDEDKEVAHAIRPMYDHSLVETLIA